MNYGILYHNCLKHYIYKTYTIQYFLYTKGIQIKKGDLLDRPCGTRNGNRTHNYPLGGGYYIHLTMQAFFIVYHKSNQKSRAFFVPCDDFVLIFFMLYVKMKKRRFSIFTKGKYYDL